MRGKLVGLMGILAAAALVLGLGSGVGSVGGQHAQSTVVVAGGNGTTGPAIISTDDGS